MDCQLAHAYDNRPGMKKTTIQYSVLTLLFTLALALSGCSSDKAASDPERLAALEVEVKALKLEAQAREATFKKELAMIGKSLESIRTLIEVEKHRADALDTPKPAPQTEGEKRDDELDTKARSFVNENLDRLLDITKKLLDKMEKELDEQMQRNQPEPEGDKI